jgi:hypothetical protein
MRRRGTFKALTLAPIGFSLYDFPHGCALSFGFPGSDGSMLHEEGSEAL